MRIDHCRLDIFVAEPFLHGPDIVALLEQMLSKAVPNGMTPDASGELCRTTGMAHGRLQTTLAGVMPADTPHAGV
jgi:hypothetical protein